MNTPTVSPSRPRQHTSPCGLTVTLTGAGEVILPGAGEGATYPQVVDALSAIPAKRVLKGAPHTRSCPCPDECAQILFWHAEQVRDGIE